MREGVREARGVPLAGLTTLQVGGPARRLVEVDDEDELVATVADADRREEPVLVLGGGSNLVVSDAGFDGTVVAVRTRGVSVTDVEGNSGPDEGAVDVRVAAGEPWDELVARTVAADLAGMEALAGIPGLTGATPIQNVGAYGQDVAQTISSVQVWDRERGQRRSFDNAHCRFSYRHSRFKGSARHVVLGVTFTLHRDRLGTPVRYAELARALGLELGGRAPLAEVREAVLGLRRGKGMVLDAADPDTRSAGSFFTNPVLGPAEADRLPERAPRYPDGQGRVKTSAAWLIENAGYGKGYGEGSARLSSKHTLALTNRGGASAQDVLALAREIRDGVRARFGIELTNEPVLLGLRL